jgi:hypothetical protein
MEIDTVAEMTGGNERGGLLGSENKTQPIVEIRTAGQDRQPEAHAGNSKTRIAVPNGTPSERLFP